MRTINVKNRLVLAALLASSAAAPAVAAPAFASANTCRISMQTASLAVPRPSKISIATARLINARVDLSMRSGS